MTMVAEIGKATPETRPTWPVPIIATHMGGDVTWLTKKPIPAGRRLLAEAFRTGEAVSFAA